VLVVAALILAALAVAIGIAGQARRLAASTRGVAPTVLMAGAATCAAVQLSWHPAATTLDNRIAWVLLVTSSAAAAITVTGRRRGRHAAIAADAVIALLFLGAVTLLAPGRAVVLKTVTLALAVGATAVVVAVLRRARTAGELRDTVLELDPAAERIIAAAPDGPIRVLAIGPAELDADEYRAYEAVHRAGKNFGTDDYVVFLEANPVPAAASAPLRVYGEDRYGYRVLRVESPVVATAVAAILIRIRDTTGRPPHVYFQWAERSARFDAVRYLRHQDSAVVPLTRAKLLSAEPDPVRRPVVHVD
jgi:hypothetical protein